MDSTLKQIEAVAYDKCGLAISNFHIEKESKEYHACTFELNGLKVVCRTAKVTPKKEGQFVTCWKRNGSGPIEPFGKNDKFDFFVVNLQQDQRIGQFVFPKSVLISKGILSTAQKDGKRAFRVYPNWVVPSSKQAERTQLWQSDYFIEINGSTYFQRVRELYQLAK